MRQFDSLSESYENVKLIVSGKRGITNLEFRNYSADETYTQFEDEPLFEDVKPIADQLLDEFIAKRLDRRMWFIPSSYPVRNKLLWWKHCYRLAASVMQTKKRKREALMLTLNSSVR